jgi:hypothetical protein
VYSRLDHYSKETNIVYLQGIYMKPLSYPSARNDNVLSTTLVCVKHFHDPWNCKHLQNEFIYVNYNGCLQNYFTEHFTNRSLCHQCFIKHKTVYFYSLSKKIL